MSNHQPSLFPAPLPFKRPSIPGFAIGDRVAFGPPFRGQEVRGRVIAMLPGANLLVIRTDAPRDSIADVNPERVRRCA
jgi:hypothetical protein